MLWHPQFRDMAATTSRPDLRKDLVYTVCVWSTSDHLGTHFHGSRVPLAQSGTRSDFMEATWLAQFKAEQEAERGVRLKVPTALNRRLSPRELAALSTPFFEQQARKLYAEMEAVALGANDEMLPCFVASRHALRLTINKLRSALEDDPLPVIGIATRLLGARGPGAPGGNPLATFLSCAVRAAQACSDNTRAWSCRIQTVVGETAEGLAIARVTQFRDVAASEQALRTRLAGRGRAYREAYASAWEDVMQDLVYAQLGGGGKARAGDSNGRR